MGKTRWQSGDSKSKELFNIGNKPSKDHPSTKRNDMSDSIKVLYHTRTSRDDCSSVTFGEGSAAADVNCGSKMTSLWEVNEEDRFHQILKEKAPNAKKTAKLVDEISDLRILLERKLRGLTATLHDVREVGQIVRNSRRGQSVKDNRNVEKISTTMNDLQSICSTLERDLPAVYSVKI